MGASLLGTPGAWWALSLSMLPSPSKLAVILRRMNSDNTNAEWSRLSCATQFTLTRKRA